ncbi:MAG: class I SAM-dependent methyltransferase [Desulfobacteraceae bacterium]|jgi:SAM-dependent methyltransferase
MNIIYKLPALLTLNILYKIFPDSERFLEKYVFNIYHFGKDHNKYSQDQFTDLINSLSGHTSLRGKTILEIGPGGSVGLGLLTLKHGAGKYIAIDVGNHLKTDSKLYTDYSRLLQDDKLINRLINKLNGKYIFNPNIINILNINQYSTYDLPDNSADIIYSNAVLEHIHDLNLCFQEMSRVLKPGGYMNHVVDLRDHIFSKDSLFFLTIPEFWLHRLFGNTGAYINRKRYSYYLRLFSKFDLKVLSLRKQYTYDGTINPALLIKYKKGDLKLLSFNIVLRKKI